MALRAVAIAVVMPMILSTPHSEAAGRAWESRIARIFVVAALVFDALPLDAIDERDDGFVALATLGFIQFRFEFGDDQSLAGGAYGIGLHGAATLGRRQRRALRGKQYRVAVELEALSAHAAQAAILDGDLVFTAAAIDADPLFDLFESLARPEQADDLAHGYLESLEVRRSFTLHLDPPFLAARLADELGERRQVHIPADDDGLLFGAREIAGIGQAATKSRGGDRLLELLGAFHGFEARRRRRSELRVAALGILVTADGGRGGRGGRRIPHVPLGDVPAFLVRHLLLPKKYTTMVLKRFSHHKHGVSCRTINMVCQNCAFPLDIRSSVDIIMARLYL